MKYLITGLLALTITASSFASCTGAYERAADKRDTSNGLLLTAGVIAAVVTAAVLTDDDNNSSSNNNNTHPRHRGPRYHHHHTYGVYYIDTYDNDNRWLGSNSFDEVLKAYNDAVVSVTSLYPYGYSSELAVIERKVAKKIIKLARRARVSSRVSDIKNSKQLTGADKVVLRNALMDGMENTGDTGFCAAGKALKRNKVITELASVLLESRS
jgi:hypothetical protein